MSHCDVAMWMVQPLVGETRGLLPTPWCTQHRPTTTNFLGPNVGSVRVRKLSVGSRLSNQGAPWALLPVIVAEPGSPTGQAQGGLSRSDPDTLGEVKAHATGRSQ